MGNRNEFKKVCRRSKTTEIQAVVKYIENLFKKSMKFSINIITITIIAVDEDDEDFDNDGRKIQSDTEKVEGCISRKFQTNGKGPLAVGRECGTFSHREDDKHVDSHTNLRS
ncbi:hypothetical protein PV326_006673 [Microctonus aethiopoides]|nr:hypothetical protein PV326_006673 [Microctonus aethiopoides]